VAELSARRRSEKAPSRGEARGEERKKMNETTPEKLIDKCLYLNCVFISYTI
jgi:hypothetical protein